MALQKDDISLINQISNGKFETLGSNIEDLATYKQILEHSASWSINSDKNSSTSFDEIMSKIDAPVDEKPTEFYFFKIAASIALLIISIFFTYNYLDTNTINAEISEIKTVYLPDSSKVILNATSRLSYSSSDWEAGRRTLSLSGQAYFEVKKGSKFSVISRSGEVSVLGTSFNVYDRAGDYKVECFTGKVSVIAKESVTNQKLILTKGLRTRMDKRDNQPLIPEVFDTDKSKQWVDGVFNFYNASLVDVFAELERQYGIEIKYNGSLEKFYTGSFKKNDLNNSIINICKPMGYDYVLNGKILSIINN